MKIPQKRGKNYQIESKMLNITQNGDFLQNNNKSTQNNNKGQISIETEI